MTGHKDMPFSSLPPELLEKGVWGFLVALFVTGATILVGYFGNTTKRKIASQQNLTDRENHFIEHLQAEMRRLKDQVAEMQQEYLALKESRDSERAAYMEQITSLKAEIKMLKRRMTDEEGR